MELSQRCVLRDGRSVVVLDEGGVACESSPDWERTWVSWEEVDRVLWTYTDEGGHVPRPKNSHSERWVPLLPHPEGLLAQEGRILPMRGDVLSRRWSRALGEAGLREIPPDMLRHTSDTLMLDAGMPRDMVDRIHGRSNHSTTYRNYYRPSPEEMRGALGPYFSGLGDSIPGGPEPEGLPTD